MKEKTKLEAALDELLLGKSTEEIIGPEGLLKQLTKAVLERAMRAELTHHLGYEKGEASGRGSGNNRNGQSGKKVQGDFGAIEVATPRDRNGSFEPKILPKHERRFAGWWKCGLPMRVSPPEDVCRSRLFWTKVPAAWKRGTTAAGRR